MDVPGSSTQQGTRIQQYTYNAGDNQWFTLPDNGDGTVSIVPVVSLLTLTIQGGSLADGAHLIQSGYTGDASQRFYFIPVYVH